MRQSPHFRGPPGLLRRYGGRKRAGRQKSPGTGPVLRPPGFSKFCAVPACAPRPRAGVSVLHLVGLRRHQMAHPRWRPCKPGGVSIQDLLSGLLPRREAAPLLPPPTFNPGEETVSISRTHYSCGCRLQPAFAAHSTVYSFVMINASLLPSTKLGSSARTAAYSGVFSDARRASVLSAHTSATPS